MCYVLGLKDVLASFKGGERERIKGRPNERASAQQKATSNYGLDGGSNAGM